MTTAPARRLAMSVMRVAGVRSARRRAARAARAAAGAERAPDRAAPGVLRGVRRAAPHGRAAGGARRRRGAAGAPAARRRRPHPGRPRARLPRRAVWRAAAAARQRAPRRPRGRRAEPAAHLRVAWCGARRARSLQSSMQQALRACPCGRLRPSPWTQGAQQLALCEHLPHAMLRWDGDGVQRQRAIRRPARHAPNPIPIACVHCGGRVAKREGAGGDEARALRAGYALDARVSDVAPARSCASVERHGACPSAGSFSVRLEGPATLWGALRGPPPRASSVLHPCMTPVGQWPSGIFLRRQSLPWL